MMRTSWMNKNIMFLPMRLMLCFSNLFWLLGQIGKLVVGLPIVLLLKLLHLKVTRTIIQSVKMCLHHLVTASKPVPSNTLQEVLRAIRIFPSLERPCIGHFAWVKGNGMHLKSSDLNVFVHQLYDYAITQFQTKKEVEQNLRILEVYCNNLEGLTYLAKNYQPAQIEAHFIKQISSINKPLNNGADIAYLPQHLAFQEVNAPTESIRGNFNFIIAFNVKAKLEEQFSEFDLAVILSNISKVMAVQGSMVWGEYLPTQQMSLLERTFSSTGFKIISKEDITLNVSIADKISQNKCGIQAKLLNNLKARLSSISCLTNMISDQSGKPQLKAMVYLVQKDKS